jgi:LDH2 family malate/lactate/ureidoglycolate dehydrogenase
MPGDIERRTRKEREANGVPVDAETLSQVLAAGASVGVKAPKEMAI